MSTVVQVPRLKNLKLPYELRDEQREAANNFINARHGVIVMPTGSGKTLIAMAIMRYFHVRTAIIVPTIALMNQWASKLRQAGVTPTRYYGGEKRITPVTIFVINSATTNQGLKYLRESFDFIIADEVHHLGSTTNRQLLPIIEEKPVAMGLTSSLKRADGMDARITRIMPVVYKMSFTEARERGQIANLHIEEVGIRLTKEEFEEYQKLTDTIRTNWLYFRSRGVTSFNELTRRYATDVRALALLSAVANRKVLLSKAVNKVAAVVKIIEYHYDEKVLLFSESIDSVDIVQRELKKEGVYCGTFHSNNDQSTNMRNLRAWSEGRFNCLLSCRSLEEGLDVPSVRVAIMMSSGSSDRQFIQRMGRVLRPKKGTTSIVYVVYAQGTLEAAFGEKMREILSR